MKFALTRSPLSSFFRAKPPLDPSLKIDAAASVTSRPVVDSPLSMSSFHKDNLDLFGPKDRIARKDEVKPKTNDNRFLEGVDFDLKDERVRNYLEVELKKHNLAKEHDLKLTAQQIKHFSLSEIEFFVYYKSKDLSVPPDEPVK